MREEDTLAESKRKYADMSAEELERRLWDTFFCPDEIDGAVFRELEELREAWERKRPQKDLPDPEEDWQRFLRDRGEELAEIIPAERPKKRTVRRLPSPLRRGLIAAVIVVLLAGAAPAADSLGLLAWVPRWNAEAGRYEPAAQEVSGESPIPAALAELGITEPVYPAKLPEGFVITETHISKEPLVLVEQYARGKDRLSITVTPTDGFRTAVYQKANDSMYEYQSGSKVHFIFAVEGTITAIRYSENYVTTISGDFSLAEMNAIIDSYNYEVS
jgi:hypothetical protein